MNLFDNNTLPPNIKITSDLSFSSTFDVEKRAYCIIIPKGELLYFPNFLASNEVNSIVSFLIKNEENIPLKDSFWSSFLLKEISDFQFENVNWFRDEYKMFGKTTLAPRFTAWIADENIEYSYSGIKLKAQQWPQVLTQLRQKLEGLIDSEFNSVLLNWYRNGEDSMGWHADNESELGKNPIIASLNLGASRDFLIRQNTDHTKKISIQLNSSDLLIMKGELQHFWQHAVPKRKRIHSPRINLTFRKILAK